MGFKASKLLLAVAAGIALTVSASSAIAQETGTVQGTVVDAANQQPLEGAQVHIPGTGLGTLTDAEGRFLLLNVPTGQQEVRVEMIGYAAASQTVAVRSDQTAQVELEIGEAAISLNEIVVTGVAEETEQAKVPFTVSQLDTEDMPVPAVDASSALQAKVPGAKVVSGSGKPGAGASIQLRGPTSIDARGRTQGPLIIVDGVITTGGLQDIDALDIQNIEVIKGAAAASLYGSRAQNGVIQVTTKRGQGIEGEDLRFTVRSEYGASSLERGISLAQNHPYRVTDSGDSFADAAGNPVSYPAAELDPEYGGVDPTAVTFQDNAYPMQTFDHLDRFFSPGNFTSNYVAVAGRSGGTNYRLSFSDQREQGIVEFTDGFERQNVRMNLDHQVSDELNFSASGFYGRSTQDNVSSSPFFTLTFMAPHVDLMEEADDGELEVRVDERSLEENPLYELRNRERTRKRDRFMGSFDLRYAPVTWFTLRGNLSYDRKNIRQSDFFPKGYKTIDAGDLEGSLERRDILQDAMNGSVTASLSRQFGDLDTETQFRYLVERQNYDRTIAAGSDFAVEGVPSLGVTTGGTNVDDQVRDIRSEGFYGITTLDYKDRYIGDILVRRDGSSLFGPDARWHTYYRGSLAWRMSQEAWWPFENIGEAKLRASHGTAGARPNFFAQYETYDVSRGQVSPEVLGNRELKPEFARETEVGVDFVAFDRVGVQLTYADSRIEDQLLLVPLAGVYGFESQWRNAGTLESQTYEASLETALIDERDLTWTTRLNFDRTTQQITELGVAPYRWGSSNAFYNREGEVFGTFYGTRWATSCEDLPSGTDCGQFQVNDDGYLVYTGGADWRDGLADQRWGTTGTVNGESYKWGMPVEAQDEDGNTFLELGSVTPDFNTSLSNSITWNDLTLYALFDAEVGADIYNQTAQWSYRELRHGAVDQSDKPDEKKKPIGYYSTLYNVNAVNSHFVEDGTYLKFRELSLAYTLGNDQLTSWFGSRLGDVEQVKLNLTGRNLKTWTNYSGYDPEVGTASGAAGSAAVGRFDGYQYPNFRKVTASVEVVF